MNGLKLLFFATVASLVISSAHARDSLYDSNNARTPNGNEVSIFGPHSAGVKYDSRMLRAARIAQQRARAHSIRRCWSYVKTALLKANVVDSRPGTAYAKQAGYELEHDFGFRKIQVSDPYAAPEGSILVYGGRGAGHVEIRTKTGFVSDFSSKTPSRRPLIGVYVKPQGDA